MGIFRLPGRAWRGFRTFRGTILWWLLVTRQRKWFITNLVLSFLATGISIVVAATTARLIDKAIDQRTEALEPLVITLVVLAVVDFVVLFANLQVSARLEYQIEFDLRNRLYEQLQRATPRDLDAVATGQVITRSLSDLELLQLLLRVLPLLVAGVPVLLGYAVYLGLINLPLTLVVISLFPINGYLVNRIRPRLWGLAFLGLNQRAEVTTAIDEPVRGIRVVKAFGAEDRERARVEVVAAKAYEFVMTRVRLEARFDLLLRAAPVLVRAGLLLFGSRLVVGGSISIGEFVIFYTFLVEGTYIAQYLDELVSLWQLAKTGAGRITQLLAVAPDQVALPVTPLPEGTTGLELHRVGVGFGDTTVLADLDLAVRPASMTVLVGGPGSGKSTVASLAAGLLAPSEGDVRLDGVDLRTIDPGDMHKAVHLVTEEPFLFARTVCENLTIGALAGALEPEVRIADDVLWAALAAAGAEDVVEALGGGLDEALGDRGMTLSGGQRQRLALARALVAPPRVLVLDDALSAVNPAREVEILRSIRQHAPTTAILCITRRPGPRTLADTFVELPPAGSHRDVAAPGELEAPEVGVFASLAASTPYDPRLVKIIGDIRLSGDRPVLDEEVATADERPRLLAMLWPQRRRIAVAIACLLGLTAVGLLPEFVFGEAADYVRDGNTEATDRLALGLFAVAFAVGTFTFLFRIASAKVNQATLYGLRRRVFERLSRLGVEYYDRELPGQVSARVVHDIDVISRFLGSGFGEPGVYQLASSTGLFLGAMGIITWLSPEVALVVLPFALTVLLLTWGQIGIADRAFARSRHWLGEVVERLQEDFAGRYVIKAFGAERRAALDFESTARQLRTARRRAATVSNGYVASIQFVLALGAAMIFWRAGSLSLAGALSVGTVISLRLYLDSALRPIRLLGRLWQEYVQARVSLRQLGQPFATPVLPEVSPSAQPCPRLVGEVAFDAVAFTYPRTTTPVLHDVSFTIEPGRVVAVVGYTGAGKSSVAKLLGRFYDPTSGTVRVDGLDLRSLDLTSYRRRLGIVPQDAFLFRGTVASNISYGSEAAVSPDAVQAAAAGVGALEVLAELEGGFGAVVEEEGRNLTAAQRQLIALARMWLVEPDILVLDEATASLDEATEAAVLDAVIGLDRTTLLITHRLAVAERADEVVMVDAGRIVEQGTHADLLAAGGAYASLWTWTGQVEDQPVP
ncbi:MAG: ABC transporter ATP-binding protein/permease [Actinomycetota bacterium]|nr:ABC transporter ATP-binding protein/permease [Actinomycetota bacterium]